MSKIEVLINQVESNLQIFVEQNKNNDLYGCRSTLRILDRLYENIQIELRMTAISEKYKPMTQL